MVKPNKATMDKQKLRAAMIQAAQSRTDYEEVKYEEFLSSHQPNDTEVRDMGDNSQYHASQELAETFHHQIHNDEEAVSLIESIDFGPKDKVEAGAVIQTPNLNLIVATSTPSFQFEGKKYVGISTQAPIYQAIQGKSIGDKCLYNNVDFTISNIQ